MCHVGAQHHHLTWWFRCQLGHGPKACTRHVILCTSFWPTSPTFCPSCGVPSTRFYCELLDSWCQNAVEFDLPEVLALFALTVCNCELFLWLIGKIVFIFGSTARPWLESASAMSIIRNVPFQTRNGKSLVSSWSFFNFWTRPPKGLRVHVSPRLRKLSRSFLPSLLNCKRCEAMILK